MRWVQRKANYALGTGGAATAGIYGTQRGLPVECSLFLRFVFLRMELPDVTFTHSTVRLGLLCAAVPAVVPTGLPGRQKASRLNT